MINYIKSIKSKNGYQYLFVKLACFILIFLITDQLVGKVFSILYSKQKSGWEYRTRYAIEETKADILIFGSSRAQQQYDPTFFEERLNQSCYNAGRDGESLTYQYTVFKAILKRYKPKALVLECENRMFMKNTAAYDRLSCFLPFYKSHPEIRSIVELRSPHEKIKLFSNMYPYNSLIFKILLGNLSKAESETIKGYLPLRGALNEPIRPVDYSKVIYDLDTNRLKFYHAIIDSCKKSGIRLVLVCSPYYSKGYGDDVSLVLAKKIAVENEIPFFDMSKGHPLLNRSNLYDDTAHVNQTGSKILSNIVIDSIIKSKVFSGIVGVPADLKNDTSGDNIIESRKY